jgi:hypothetical protein
MIASLRFLHATIVHKYHVYCAGRRLGVGIWQLLIHDLSKFRPSEFVPYGKFFYSMQGAGWLKAVPHNDYRPHMLHAWLRHIQRNAHHWQYWLIVNGGSVVASRGTTVDVNPIDPLPMPRKYVREMLADWMGAGRAYQGEYPKSIETWKWWQENKDQLVLHPATREQLTIAIYDWFQPNDQPGEHILHGTWISHEELVWGKPS